MGWKKEGLGGDGGADVASRCLDARTDGVMRSRSGVELKGCFKLHGIVQAKSSIIHTEQKVLTLNYANQ